MQHPPSQPGAAPVGRRALLQGATVTAGALAALGLSGALGSEVALAGGGASPFAYVQGLLTRIPLGDYGHGLALAMVTNQGPYGALPYQTPGPCSYANGFLYRTDAGFDGWAHSIFARADRDAAFEGSRVDQLGVSIRTQPASQLVTITFTLRSWGNGQFTLSNLQYDPIAGVLYGYGASVGQLTNSALYVLSLGEQLIAP